MRLPAVCIVLALSLVVGPLQAQAPPRDDQAAFEAAANDRWAHPEASAKALRRLMEATQNTSVRQQCAATLIGVLASQLHQYEAATEVLLAEEARLAPQPAEWLASPDTWQVGSEDAAAVLALAEKLVADHPNSAAAWALLGHRATASQKPERAVEA